MPPSIVGPLPSPGNNLESVPKMSNANTQAQVCQNMYLLITIQLQDKLLKHIGPLFKQKVGLLPIGLHVK